MYEDDVRCNNCEWTGIDGEDTELVEDGGEYFKACPNCMTDAWLVDI